MKLCAYECPAVCDFCIWYNYNGERGVFIGDGYCRLNGENKWPEDVCPNFVCMNWGKTAP